MVKNRRGVTLIEFVMIITTVSIIATAASVVLIYVWQEFAYLPRQLRVRQAGHAALDEIIEGSGSIKGLRSAKSITSAAAAQVNYKYGYPAPADEHTVSIRWDSSGRRFYRSVDSAVEREIPYYASSVNIEGKETPGAIFTYYKSDGSAWVSGTDALSLIKRVRIEISVTTGSGAFTGYQAALKMSSGVEVKQY
ncbi:MAG: hypothetical protein HY589_02590 [Candidatus Omnitrophica bacterium]|nr:hypothetical protein [Candidatus Omnitrophota bacterium]